MIDLTNLTPLQESVAHRFLDLLEEGETVDHTNFPEMSQREFEALADAIVEYATSPRQ